MKLPPPPCAVLLVSDIKYVDWISQYAGITNLDEWRIIRAFVVSNVCLEHVESEHQQSCMFYLSSKNHARKTSLGGLGKIAFACHVNTAALWMFTGTGNRKECSPPAITLLEANIFDIWHLCLFMANIGQFIMFSSEFDLRFIQILLSHYSLNIVGIS